MGNLSSKTTKRLAEAAVIGCLEEVGYDVDEINGYILAQKYGEPDLIIYVTGRALSDNESTPIRVLGNSVKKLNAGSSKRAGTYIPCIGFFVIKYGIDNMELCIVPITTIMKHGTKGGQYSLSGNNYHYNFAKVNGDTLPVGSIVRAVWNGKIFKK